MSEWFARIIRSLRRHARMWTLVSTAVVIAVFSAGLLALAGDGHPMSVVDEHVHYDYVIRVLGGELPWRGAPYTQGLVDQWSCGVGHEAGSPYPCGDERFTVSTLPAGKYTSGYIHYPTYFIGAALFADFSAWVTGNTGLIATISAVRIYSAILTIAGVISCALFAWAIGMRTGRLIAATTVPVAASMIVLLGTLVNPGSTAILAGSLIAGTGILWIVRGKGFLWFVIASALASLVAVTDSLPVGGFLFLIAVTLVAERLGWRLEGSWRPRWWHFWVLVGTILTPIIVWGQYIRITATQPNKALFGFIAPTGKKDAIVGMVTEFVNLHTPWVESMGIWAHPQTLVGRVLRAAATGMPLWITVFVLGVLILVVLRIILRDGGVMSSALPPRAQARQRVLSPVYVLTAGTVGTLLLYPPALRLSNWLTFGFDFGIVGRYSIALSPLLVLLVLSLFNRRPFGVLLAAMGVVGSLGVVAAAL